MRIKETYYGIFLGNRQLKYGSDVTEWLTEKSANKFRSEVLSLFKTQKLTHIFSYTENQWRRSRVMAFQLGFVKGGK